MSDAIVKRLLNIIPLEYQVFVGRVLILSKKSDIKDLLNSLNSNNCSLSLVENGSNVEVIGTFFIEDENKTITLGTLPKAISSKIIKYQLFGHINIYLSCYRINDKPQEIEMEFEISIDKNIYNSISEQLADDDKNVEIEKKTKALKKVIYYDKDFNDKFIKEVTPYQKKILKHYGIKVSRNMTKIEAHSIIENKISAYDIEEFVHLTNLYEILISSKSHYGIKKISQSKFFLIVDKLKWQKKDLVSIDENDIVNLLDDDFRNNDSW